jgi:hypothetical protein
MEIDSHLGCAMSGLTADARTMIDHARVTAQNHTFTYDEKIKVESATQAVCDLALRFGESMDNEDAMMVSDISMSRRFATLMSLSSPESTVWCRFVNCRCRRARSTIVRSNRRIIQRLCTDVLSPYQISHRPVRHIRSIRSESYRKWVRSRTSRTTR